MTLTPAASTGAAEMLDRPVTVNGLTIPNRIAMAPMIRQFSPDGIAGEDVASCYARRAAAGVGLILTEGAYPGHPSVGDNGRVLCFHGEQQLEDWAKVAEAVHAAGGTTVPQLSNIGLCGQHP